MRLSTVWPLVLPALAAAQQQVPLTDKLKGWFSQAQDYVQAAASIPADAGASKVASHAVTPLNANNWRSVIKHSGAVKPYNPPEAWMVYITGENKTCGPECKKVDRVWNESVALFATDISAPKLASLNCDEDQLLCGAWAAGVPSIWFFLVPQPLPDQSTGPTPLNIFPLNTTTATVTDITSIHTRRLYLHELSYTGIMHPFDGILAKLGLTMPLAYVLWGLAKIPSWAFMIAVSFFSRSFMSRRMPRGPPAQGAQSAPTPS